MALHQVLASRELLSLIFDHLTPPEFDHGDALPMDGTYTEYLVCTRALNAAARTSRTLSASALAVLWRRLDYIGNLLCMLPGYKDIGGYGHDEMLIISADITPSLWARIRQYTLLVKAVNQRNWDWIHPYTWVLLARWCRGEPLFPYVETFRVLPMSARSPVQTLFLTPTLRHLWLTLEDAPTLEDVQVGAILLREIAVAARGLRTLHVKSKMKAGFSMLAGIVQGLVELRCVEFVGIPIQRSEVDVLARLPFLESLSATIMLPAALRRSDSDDENHEDGSEENGSAVDEDEDGDGDEEEDGEMDDNNDPSVVAQRIHDVRGPVAFHALRQLTLSGSLSQQYLVLGYYPPHLEALSLQFTDTTTFGAVKETISANVANVPPTLSSFSLKTSKKWEEEGDLDLLDLIRPVLSLQDLETVSLEFRDVPGVSDADIAAMTDAWPRLTTLRLPPSGLTGDPKRTRPTQRALVRIAAFCPLLRVLAFPEIVFNKLPLRAPVTNHSLRTLSFDLVEADPERRRNTYASPFEMGIAVDLLFPHLELREREDPKPPEPSDEGREAYWYSLVPKRKVSSWYEVRPYIEAAQAGRARGKVLRDSSRYRPRMSILWSG